MVVERTDFDPDDHRRDCAFLAKRAKITDENEWDASKPSGYIECLRYLRSKGFRWKPDAGTRVRANAIGIA